MQLDQYHDLSIDQFHSYCADHHEKKYVLVDVRLPEEYEDEHIAGSILMPLAELTQRLTELPEDRDIIFYCNSGRRSRIAALFATSVPFCQKKIYNVVGGILAYFERTLPDYPTLTAVDLDSGMEDLLYSAMNLERGTSLFYKAVLQETGETPFRATIEKIAQAEEAHARMLYSFWKKEQSQPPDFEELYNGLSGELIEGGQSLEEQLARFAALDGSSSQPLLEMILDIEYAAYDLYCTVATKVQGSPMEESFLDLAQAEKHHMQLAATAFKNWKAEADQEN